VGEGKFLAVPVVVVEPDGGGCGWAEYEQDGWDKDEEGKHGSDEATRGGGGAEETF